jgi:hypothetical protein
MTETKTAICDVSEIADAVMYLNDAEGMPDDGDARFARMTDYRLQMTERRDEGEVSGEQ